MSKRISTCSWALALACGILIVSSAVDRAVTAAPPSTEPSPTAEKNAVTPVGSAFPSVSSSVEAVSTVEGSRIQEKSSESAEQHSVPLQEVQGEKQPEKGEKQPEKEDSHIQRVAGNLPSSGTLRNQMDDQDLIYDSPQLENEEYDEADDDDDSEDDDDFDDYEDDDDEDEFGKGDELENTNNGGDTTEGTEGEVEIVHQKYPPPPELLQVFVGVAYDLPIQLRPREGGADPGYLQLMLDEKLFNEQMNRISNSEDTEGELHKYPPPIEEVPKTNGVFSVCYVKEIEELEIRFERAVELGEGVYVPLHRMIDFQRYKDFTRGNPGVQDVQLSADHYLSAIHDWNQTYFDVLRELKNRTHLKIGGIWFGPPDYQKIDSLLKQNPGLFEGVYIDWEDGQGACMNNLSRPPKKNADGTQTYWAGKPDFFFRYYMGGQDGDVCKLSDGQSYIRDTPVNVGRDLNLPDRVSPVFPCFGGNEGICYKAFSKFIEEACDSDLQRYSFAIYDRHSDRMRLMLEEGCKNLGVPVPAMDFINAV